MDIKLTPSTILGKVNAPPSKSVAHRLLIASFLSGKRIKLNNLGSSVDVEVTISALKKFGAEIEKTESGVIIKRGELPTEKVVIDCRESGSSLRFLLPVAVALGIKAEFTGAKRLLERPILELIETLNSNGETVKGLEVVSKLKSGNYKIYGGVSSQYITGLMLALSEVKGSLEIVGEPVSKPYIDITLDVLSKFGVSIKKKGNIYEIGGYKAENGEFTVEGDWSGAAFNLVLGAINGEVTINGLNLNSYQGDMKILEVLKLMGAKIDTTSGVTVKKSDLKGITYDCENIPDLVQIISVAASYANGVTVLENVQRLKLKESDRISAIIGALSQVNVNATYDGNNLTIRGSKPTGATLSGGNDHRTVMSSIVLASSASGQSIITGVEAMNKSYPEFLNDYISLGGKVSGNI